MSLAAMVKEHRLAAGLTQEELAEAAQVSARPSATSSAAFEAGSTATRLNGSLEP